MSSPSLRASASRFDSTKILAYLPILVLSLVALWQMTATRNGHMSPWKGGGFGMFATSDLPSMRFVRVALERDINGKTSTTAVDVPQHDPELKRLEKALRTRFSQQGLRELSQHLAAADWRVYIPPNAADQSWKSARIGVLGAPGTLSTETEPVEFDKVKVTFHRLRFSPERHKLEATKLGEASAYKLKRRSS